MIKTQVIKKGKDPIAVIIDYREYLRLKEMAQDRAEYAEAIDSEKKNRRLTPLKEVKKRLGL